MKAKKKKKMLVGYNDHIIYYIYLLDKKKVICIKNLKIMKNADGKANSQLISYNAITASQNDIMGNIFTLSPYTQYFSPSLHIT